MTEDRRRKLVSRLALGAEPLRRINQSLSCLQDQSHLLGRHVAGEQAAGISSVASEASVKVVGAVLMEQAGCSGKVLDVCRQAGNVLRDRDSTRDQERVPRVSEVDVVRRLAPLDRFLRQRRRRRRRHRQLFGDGSLLRGRNVLLQRQLRVRVPAKGRKLGAEEWFVTSGAAAPAVAALALAVQCNWGSKKRIFSY